MVNISSHLNEAEMKNLFLQDTTIRICLNMFEIDILISQINSSYLADLIRLNEQSFKQFAVSNGSPNPEVYLKKLEWAIRDQKLNYDQEQVVVLTREQWLIATLILASFHTYLDTHSSSMSDLEYIKVKECVDCVLAKIAFEIPASKKRVLH
jgi:hypothetical protein